MLRLKQRHSKYILFQVQPFCNFTNTYSASYIRKKMPKLMGDEAKNMGRVRNYWPLKKSVVTPLATQVFYKALYRVCTPNPTNQRDQTILRILLSNNISNELRISNFLKTNYENSQQFKRKTNKRLEFNYIE
jgi:hypothetical protein